MNPIGLLIDSGDSNRLALYLEEIFLIEGYHAYDLIDLAESDEFTLRLSDRPLYVISDTAAAKIKKTNLEHYLNDGGCLIAIRAPAEWASLFGMEATQASVWLSYTQTNGGYLIANRLSPLTLSIQADSIQFLGEADLYKPQGAKVLNHISAAVDSPSIYPGIAVNEFGKGKAGLFVYDLSACVVRLHQGDPGRSSLGNDPDPNRDGKYTPDELFGGQLDYNLRGIPQADIHQDYLVAMIDWMRAPSSTQPRFWHFPKAARSVAVMTGDSDGMTTEEYEATLNAFRKHDAKFTCYIMDKDQPSVPAEQAGRLRDEGHDFGPHLFCELKPTVEQMRAEVHRAVESFRKTYGFQPLTHRGHSGIWVGWTEMAEILSREGIRMDTNFYAGVGIRNGFLNGSALPVKFMDLQGHVIDLYEQSTPIMDDYFSPKLLLEPASYESAVRASIQLLKTCCATHGVLMPDFHPVYSGARGRHHNHLPWIEQLMLACRDAGVRCIGAGEWALFNDAKRALKIENYRWDGEKHELAFEIRAERAIQDATLLLPLDSYDVIATKHPNKTIPVGYAQLENRTWNSLDITLQGGERLFVLLKFRKPPASSKA